MDLQGWFGWFTPEDYELMDDKQKQEFALNHLKERIRNGEQAHEILGIHPREQYYINKLVLGYIKFDCLLYRRIMSDIQTTKEATQDGENS